MPRVIEEINRRIEAIPNYTLAGLEKAATLINNETLRGSVTTPVDYGNLRHSWFVVTSRGAISVGGGRSHTPEGASEGFTGPLAGRYAAGHKAMLQEMQGKAQLLAQHHGGPFIIIGYSVNYALWVHENIGARFKAPTGPKWFQRALEKHRDTIVDKVAEEARKGMKR